MSTFSKLRLGVFTLLVVGAAALLNGLFKGFGSGGGSGSDVIQIPSGSNHISTPAPPPTESETPAVPAPAADANVVHVIIDGSQYLLANSVDDENPQPVEIPRIVELARSAKGDGDGIRVRVHRSPSSLPTPENNLRDALQSAGLDESAVRWD